MKDFVSGIITAVSLLLFMSSNAIAQNQITVNGKDFTVDDNTILLDREGIFAISNAFTDPAAAFSKINEIGKDATLLIAPSVYWLDNPDDPEIRSDKDGTPFGVRIKCDNLKIIGLAENPEDVVLAVNRGQTQGAVGNFTMFEFSGNSLETENITFGNYCNIDLVYPRNPDFNRTRRKDAIVQAQIGICRDTEKLYANNCRFLSRLNLCPFIGAHRSLYEKCHFESTDDALSGSAVYLDCSFLFCSSKPFYTTDETGAIFLNCDIQSLCDGTQYFTKVPGQVTAIDTRFSGNDNLNIGWTRDASDLRCFQHNVSLNGKPYTIDADRPDLWVALEGNSLMDAYVVECNGERFYNLPNLLNGNDNWDPKNMNGKVADAEKILGRKLTGIPVAMRMRADKTDLSPLNDTAKIIATPLLWGGYNAGTEYPITFISDNNKPENVEKKITHTLTNGLTASLTLSMSPSLREAPSFAENPQVRFDAQRGRYYVDYKLNGTGEDNSIIYWARVSSDKPGEQPYFVKKGAHHLDASYAPVAGDYKNDLMAFVVPKFKDSKEGDMMASSSIVVEKNDGIKDYPESNLSTDFSDIPIVGKSNGLSSVWNFDVYKPLDTTHVTNWEAVEGPGWYYGKGFDASVSEGLVQSERGARLSYVPTRDGCRTMKAQLVVEPAKSGGQGFGSATSQYMDICVKFDPSTLNGYALRIERTPDYDSAVRFSLVKYDNGKTSIINEGVVSNCYRTACHISTEIKDGVLTATAHTDAPEVKSKHGDVASSVSLSTPIEDTSLAGFCIQHTGSTGPSSTLIKSLSLSWD